MLTGLTAYSPAIFALNDMLRQQLALTRSFIDSTRRHYKSVLESLGPDYKYTTLQETKEVRSHFSAMTRPQTSYIFMMLFYHNISHVANRTIFFPVVHPRSQAAQTKY